ncbi:hypothetical protein [Streptomyces sp. NPDC048111]|uniref:hypothetical protein n=1 Tax=Streptomyces sp. NPDC048111 TaxID=3365500 RepID=UPI003716626F
MESLIAAVREQDEAARFLAWPGDFDLERGDHVEDVHLASGAALEGFAGDGAGGTYRLDEDRRRDPRQSSRLLSPNL